MLLRLLDTQKVQRNALVRNMRCRSVNLVDAAENTFKGHSQKYGAIQIGYVVKHT